jgi:hypothetical protein
MLIIKRFLKILDLPVIVLDLVNDHAQEKEKDVILPAKEVILMTETETSNVIIAINLAI